MMPTRPASPVVSPDDPQLASMGRERVAGADQLAGMLAATPDERLDSLVAILRFVADARTALRERDSDGTTPAA